MRKSALWFAKNFGYDIINAQEKTEGAEMEV